MKQYRQPAPAIHVEIDKGQYQVCEAQNGGLGPHHRIGPKFPTGKGAYQLATVIEERRRNPISPLRVEASPAGADSPAPPSGSQSASAEAASA